MRHNEQNQHTRNMKRITLIQQIKVRRWMKNYTKSTFLWNWYRHRTPLKCLPHSGIEHDFFFRSSSTESYCMMDRWHWNLILEILFFSQSICFEHLKMVSFQEVFDFYSKCVQMSKIPPSFFKLNPRVIHYQLKFVAFNSPSPSSSSLS